MAAFQRKSTNQKNQIFPAGLRVQFNPPDTANILHIDPSGEEFELESFPSSLQEYLNRIQFRCIILNLETTDFLIADNVLILSGDVLEALSDLCSHAQKQSFFGLQLKYRQVSRTLNDVNNELPDIEFLSLLRGLRESQRVALGKEQYQNYIDLLKNASTNSNDRFLNELLQNADDCLYSDQVIPTFSLDIKGTSVTTQYNEQGFTKSNVRAITAIGESTKKKLAGECTIGEKGIGFKSVFSIASEVEIHSGDFHFLLTKGHPTVPNIIHGRDSSDTGTTMILHLEKELPSQLLMPSNILHLCLCLRKLKDIRIGKTHIRIEDTHTIASASASGIASALAVAFVHLLHCLFVTFSICFLKHLVDLLVVPVGTASDPYCIPCHNYLVFGVSGLRRLLMSLSVGTDFISPFRSASSLFSLLISSSCSRVLA